MLEVIATSLLLGGSVGYAAGLLRTRGSSSPAAQSSQSVSETASTGHKQLLIQEQQFRTLFDAAPECIKIQSPEGIVEAMNDAGLAILETTQASRIIGKSVYGIIAPEYHDAYRELSNKVFRGESAYLEFELITFAGNRCWLESHAVPLRDLDGQIISLMAITRDVSERVEMTEELERQRSHLQTIIESEPECVKIQDREGTILEMNPAGLSLLDSQQASDVIGHSIYDYLNDGFREDYQQLTKQVFEGHRASMEFEVTTNRGNKRWLETHAAPLRNKNGEVSALLAVTRDINARKHGEERLRKQQNELAHICRLSTMGELASGLAHELNQPLCAISSYSESALMLYKNAHSTDDDRPTQIDGLLEKIVAQVDRANDIVQRLRTFVRNSKPVPTSNNVHAMLNDVLHFVEPDLQHNNVTLEMPNRKIFRPVCVDRVQIEQVLLNLITNGIHAGKDNGKQAQIIEVTLEDSSEGLCIGIRDFGKGITPDIADRLFTPFFTTKSKGMGMGLAISRRIVESHAGRLWYEPADPGSRFKLLLPWAEQKTCANLPFTW